MNKFFKITKASIILAVSIMVQCLAFIIKIIIGIALDDKASKDNSTNSFYVIDEKGNEIIDDGVTYVFDLDNQRDYKGPL